ncbi:MAG: hypothetical protein ACM3UZ_10275 [Acidobacteriota bacterium]
MKGIIEYSDNDHLCFGFNGYEDWEYFLPIVKIIEAQIKPEYLHNLGGITSMTCKCIKNGVPFIIEYDSWTGNSLVFEGEKTETIRKFLKDLADEIFSYLKVM